MKTKSRDSGKLKIGDDWNAIRIIALSQSNPLKALAEFVENSIDAHAKTITITRGKEHGAHYLAIKDDGDGAPRDAEGLPDFKYVATHICDSIKRGLKAEGSGTGLQGEFGIGLLSFWTVGDSLTMISTGRDQRAYQMTMSKGDSRYEVSPRRVLFAEKGTELKISPLLEGIRSLSGEKIQWYLASELRDRIRDAKVRVTVIDQLETPMNPAAVNSRGLPGYTFERAAGELWRCRFEAERNIIVVNSGHRDFVFATRNRALQLRYLVRLYVKELVLKNFAGLAADQLLERMIELSLYAEEKLKSG